MKDWLPLDAPFQTSIQWGHYKLYPCLCRSKQTDCTMALKEDLETMRRLYHNGCEEAFREHVTHILSTYTDDESKALFAECMDELSEDTLRKIEELREECRRLASLQ